MLSCCLCDCNLQQRGAAHIPASAAALGVHNMSHISSLTADTETRRGVSFGASWARLAPTRRLQPPIILFSHARLPISYCSTMFYSRGQPLARCIHAPTRQSHAERAEPCWHTLITMNACMQYVRYEQTVYVSRRHNPYVLL